MILIPSIYNAILEGIATGIQQMAVLIDPDKFDENNAKGFLARLPQQITYVFVGGSTVELEKTETTVTAIKKHTSLPVILFPGDYTQITDAANALLFLSLISGRNPEYLIEQQVKSVSKLRQSDLEIIPTGYILIDGGKPCAVEIVSETRALACDEINAIVNTALAGQYSGKKIIYLEAGSGALNPVSKEIITAVKKAISIPLIVGGGIRTTQQLWLAYDAGADMVVVGTAFEQGGMG